MDPVWRRSIDSLAETLRELARGSGQATLLEADGTLLYASAHEASGLLNGALRLRPGLPAEDLVARADAFFSSLGRGYLVWARAGVDDDLTDVLGPPAAEDPQMVLDHRPAPPMLGPDTAIAPVTDEAGRAVFVDVAAEAFADEVDGSIWPAAYPTLASIRGRHVAAFVLREAGEPVAVAAVYLHRGTAEVIHVGTIAAARGRRFGEAVTRAAVRHGFDRGADLATLQATKLGEPVYRRIGFQEIGRWHWFLRDPAPAS